MTGSGGTAGPPPATPGPARIAGMLSLSAITPTGAPTALDTTPTIVEANYRLSITDWTRLLLACALLVILAAVIVFQFSRSSALDQQCVLVLDAKTRQVVVEPTKALCETRIAAYNAIGAQTQIVFTAIVGLVGSVVGFFFGQNSDKVPR